MPTWLFCTEVGTPLDASRVRKAFARVLQAAALPAHFSPHCLRHTFASLLLQQGESPAYVQRQLGHASIQLTVDTYGKWLPMGNKPAVNRLDEPSGSKVVAKKESEVPDTLETPDSIGGPSRTRTLDPLIKSWLHPTRRLGERRVKSCFSTASNVFAHGIVLSDRITRKRLALSPIVRQRVRRPAPLGPASASSTSGRARGGAGINGDARAEVQQ
jgi:hypothetical protein